MRAGLHPVHWFSAHPQDDVSRRRVPDPPLPLCPCPAGWGHNLAAPVHHVSSGVHGPPPLRLALSLNAPGGGARRPLSDAWGAEFGAVCRDWAYLAHGTLPSDLCAGSAEFGERADPVWVTTARLFPGR